MIDTKTFPVEDAMTNNPLSDIKIVAKLPYDIDDE